MLILPTWIDKSIIRLTDIWPLKKYITGVGVRKDHPSEYHQAGWEAERLANEIEYFPTWIPTDEKGLLEHIKDKEIKLVDDYSTATYKIAVNGNTIS